jgi:hypothetical protein
MRGWPKFTEHDPVSSTVTLQFVHIGGLAKFQERLEQTYQFQNVSTYIVNRHSFKFDSTRLEHTCSTTTPKFKGTWQFNNLADFMNNQANALTQLVWRRRYIPLRS